MQYCQYKFVLLFQNPMRDSYVNNMEEVLSANESQKNKIEFLQRERLRRDHYLSDLQENLALNKETLIQYNHLGCNEKAINKLVNETTVLSNKIKEYYQEYQTINALLLMQQQMRSEDKQFYQQRMIQFQNKIVDLRKYLHDKQESFTSVVVRLKKYEDLAQPSMEDKLHSFKKEIGEKSVNEFITDVIKEKNFYKNEYEKMRKDYYVFSEMKNVIMNRFQEAQVIIDKYEKDNAGKLNTLIGNLYQKMEEEKEKKTHKKMEPNRELIRLLKKQKLNNELLEEALNDAIEKNQELVAIKDIFEKNAQKLQNKCRLLYSQNTIFALRIAEYDQHYYRRYAHHRKYYEEGEIQGLRFITEHRLKEYGRNIMQYYESNAKLYQQYNEKLREDVGKWGQFICEAQNIKKSLVKQNLMVKSSSTPILIVGFELEEESDKLVIEQF